MNVEVAPGRNHSDWIRAYMDYTVNSEAPDSLHFWTAVSTIAAALQRKVWIDEHEFKWTPNFYIIFVAPPGIATKSTSINIGMKLLQDIEGIHFGPDSMTWQGLTMALTDAKNVVETEGIFLIHSSITCAVGELGTFLKTRETELVSVLTDLWDCRARPWRHRVKTGDNPTTEIINPWVNIIGATTPAWMRNNFNSEVMEGGLTSRCVFVSVNSKRRLVPYPSQEISSHAFYEKEKRLIEDLRLICDLKGQYHLSPEAIKWGSEWYTTHWGGGVPTDIGDRYSGYLARKQTHIHKLAMVLAAARRNDLIITKEDLMIAERAVTSMELDTQSLFRRIGATNTARLSEDVRKYIFDKKGAGERDVWRMFMAYMTHREMLDILNGLCNAGMLVRVSGDDGGNYFIPTHAD